MSEELDDPLAEFAAARRKRRLIGLAASVAAALVLAGGWAWWKATGLPTIDAETEAEVHEAMDAIDTLPRDLHGALAAKAMAELEGDRLPPAMHAAFEDCTLVPPEMVGMVALKPFAEDEESLRAWTVACPAGADAIAAVIQTGDIDALFADCELGRWSLIDGHAARRVSAGRLILAHAAWGWLVDHHSETELERRVLRVFVQG